MNAPPAAPHAAFEIRPAAARGVERGRGASAALGRPAKVAIGVGAALIAVAIRYVLPLAPNQLPALTVVVAVSLTGTLVGLSAGLAAAIVGGLASWYLFFTPDRFAFTPAGSIPLFAFAVTSAAILTTSHLYRVHAQRGHAAELAIAQQQTASAELFARELAHRLKNALAIVQSVARQTLRDESPQTQSFNARLQALAAAHDLLTAHVERPTATLGDVVRSSLAPFLDRQDRVRLTAPPVTIPSQTVISLALLLHELATNAAKYGALSVPEGAITLEVEDAPDRIRLTWRESGGPPPAAETRGGFGSKLLARIGEQPEVTFAPEGLCYRVTMRKA